MKKFPFCVVMPASGQGSRMQSIIPKQYLELDGHPVIYHSLLPFLANEQCQHVVVVCELETAASMLSTLNHPKLRYVEGGQERYHSVLNGCLMLMNTLQIDTEMWVMVHDAARPGITQEMIEHLMISLGEDSVGGILALPAVDTIKQVDDHLRITQTLPRHQIWQAQTPQMFRLGMLIQAIEQSIEHQYEITDEASAIEKLGLQPCIVEGYADNFKITYPDDLLRMAHLFKQRQM